MNIDHGRRPVGRKVRALKSEAPNLQIPGLRNFLAMVQRRRIIILFVSCLAGAATFAFEQAQTPKFAATALVLVDPDPSELALQAGAGDPDFNSQMMAAQLKVIRSPAFAEQIVDDLKLVSDPNYNGASAADGPFSFAAPYFANFLKHEPPSSPAARRAIAQQRVAKEISVTRKGQSFLIQVSATTKEPLRSSQIANRLVELYLEAQLTNRYVPKAGAPATSTNFLAIASAREMAEASTPVKPESKSGLIAVTLIVLVGLLSGLAIGAWVDFSDRGVGGLKDAARKVGRYALASVPLLRAADFKDLPAAQRLPADYVLAKQMSPYAEAMRAIRTALLYAEEIQRPKVICITSARPREGKTTTALALARVSAMAGQKVLIVDCDLRRRAVNALLSINPKSGLLDVVTGAAEWRSVVVKDQFPGMELLVKDQFAGIDILPAAESFFPPRDVFGSVAMQRLLDELRVAYDLVILDTPPVMTVTETRIIARLADQTIMMVHWTKTPAETVKSAVRVLETTGSSVVGLALNFVDPKALGRLSVADTAYQVKFAERYFSS